MQIRRSQEDYLEAMLFMQERKGYIRSVDVAEYLGVTKPSVSYATKVLREAGYISADSDGRIILTDTGLEIAERMYKRHRLLTEFLVHLGVDEKSAVDDACKIEHDISEQSFQAICSHIKKARDSGLL